MAKLTITLDTEKTESGGCQVTGTLLKVGESEAEVFVTSGPDERQGLVECLDYFAAVISEDQSRLPPGVSVRRVELD
jgi:hypothetical protein